MKVNINGKNKNNNNTKPVTLTMAQIQMIQNDDVIAFMQKIKCVVPTSTSITAHFKNGGSITAFYDGNYEKCNIHGKPCGSGGFKSGTGVTVNGHVQIGVDGRTMLIERFIAVCIDFYNDEIKSSYSNLVANVMDGSGSKYTSHELSIKPDLSPENLEWCSLQDNASHGQLIKKLAQRTGHVYRFSASDKVLHDLLYNGSTKALIEYCEKYLVRIR